MTITQTDESSLRKPLRLWPGVVIVILQWLVRFALPVVAPDTMQIGVLAGVAGGAAIVVFGFSPWLWLSLAMLAVAGAGDMVSGIFRHSILQAAVEDRYRGRLDGIGMAVWATGPSLGDVESGVVASVTSVPFSIVSGGVLTIVGVGLLRWFAPGFWRYDARAPQV